MTKLVKFPLNNGGSVVVEVDERQSGPVPVAKSGDIAGEAKMTFEQATAHIKPIATTILNQLNDIGPSETEVEIGVTFSAEAGVILAKTSAEGTCKVKLTWKKVD